MKSIFLIVFILLIKVTSTQSQSLRDSVRSNWNQLNNNIDLQVTFTQSKYSFWGIGIAKTLTKRKGCAFGNGSEGYSFLYNYNPKHKIYGTEISTWMSVFNTFPLGLNLNSYFQNEKYQIGLKPFFGFGSDRLNIVYSYNIVLKRKDEINIGNHSVRLNLFIKCIKLK